MLRHPRNISQHPGVFPLHIPHMFTNHRATRNPLSPHPRPCSLQTHTAGSGSQIYKTGNLNSLPYPLSIKLNNQKRCYANISHCNVLTYTCGFQHRITYIAFIETKTTSFFYDYTFTQLSYPHNAITSHNPTRTSSFTGRLTVCSL